MSKKLRENKLLFYPYQIYKYIVFFPLLGIFTLIFGSLAVVFSIILGDKAGSFFGVLWARTNAFFIPMFIKVTGKENIDKKQSYVVIANHQSMVDILAIYGWLPIDFRWVMKIELRKVPVLGYACHQIGHVFIDRKNPEAAIASINAAKEKIKDGTAIFFFPEGTRSDDGNMLKFKAGAFRIALDMDLPLLPVSIVGTKDIVPNNTTSLFPGFARMIIHQPIDTKGFSQNNLATFRELIAKGRESIQKGLDEHSM